MIHQPSGGFRGPAADVEIHAREILKVKEKLNDILSQHTGRTSEQIGADSDRDRYMSAEEAKEYGIVDDIFVRTEETEKT
jgi:ATP-dependent Clp protease protease subunit